MKEVMLQVLRCRKEKLLLGDAFRFQQMHSSFSSHSESVNGPERHKDLSHFLIFVGVGKKCLLVQLAQTNFPEPLNSPTAS